ncbi:hypothetical protein QFC21_002554 [Naganishia friedmannii]|uniref:Uncharacterized protein n=1 Tax=Naganishia friedmannii TaxID=89922 RepID=A0ACC2VUW9_9TREE|nr:hypothetical protein QFC21_002554 [Naganishia friedmannii]
MQVESIRKSTFLPPPPPPPPTTSRSASAKRATTTKSKSVQQPPQTWPYTASSHPHLTPSTLAKAGYYYSPDPPASTSGSDVEEDDQCCCFTCGKKLGGWDTTDDPFVEHWKRSADAAASGSGGEVAQPSTNTQPRLHIYPRSEAHLHPRSELMNKAREETYFPSAHLVQLQQKQEGKEGKSAKSGKEGKGWWPHKVKRAWLCTVPNLAKAGFVYTPTVEEDDCVTCFYCNYSVSDWEPVDDPWKQHHDKSPNCPFFTETVEGALDGNGKGDGVLDVDASDEEVSELPTTVRSKAAAGSKRPTSRSTSAATKARRTIIAPVPLLPPATLTKSTTRSRIPNTATRPEMETPVVSTTTSREASDDEKDAQDAQTEVKAGKGRPKRATTSTAKASAKTTKTTTTRKGTRRTTKADTAESSDDGAEEPVTTAAEDEDTGVDELDALPRSTQSRAKASTRGTATTAAKKSAVSRKPAGRTAKAKPAPEPEEVASQTMGIARAVSSSVLDVSDVEMASSHVTASENDQSETEKEASQTDVEEHRREYLAEEEIVKSHRMQMVEVGAREAMAVMQNLGSRRLDTVRALTTTRDESATPRAAISKQNLGPGNDNNETPSSSSAALREHASEVIELTADEERLTVVEYVRRMYARRREALLGAGEAKIADWEEKAGQARAFIASIPTRN